MLPGLRPDPRSALQSELEISLSGDLLHLTDEDDTHSEINGAFGEMGSSCNFPTRNQKRKAPPVPVSSSKQAGR